MKSGKTIAVLGLLLVLMAGLGLGIGTIQDRMNNIRRTAKLTETAPLRNAPPMVAFTTVALGGFRGLVADWLWLRLTRLQDQGSYFEMVQLASWIVKLQPRFTGAAAFLAWNMAYNVSVSFTSFEDRWRWVRKGIELIRDEALDYNPGDPELYKELAWVYHHKLGAYMDDANRYYKQELAKEMIRVFGEYPPDWNALAAAPLTEGELRRSLADKPGFDAFLRKHDWSFTDFERRFRKADGLPESIAEETANAPWKTVVENCLRRRWIQIRYKLDPARIARLNQKYGPLDWRLPEAHAIYWASLGLETADEKVNIACERVTFQALANAFKTARLIYLKDVNVLEMSPNIGLVDAVNQSYVDAMEKHKGNKSVYASYENFLVDAVVVLYTFGQQKKAKEYLGKARDMYSNKRYRKSLDQFALDELAKDMAQASPQQAQGTVRGYLVQCCYSLALGETDRAMAFESISHKIWIKYMRQIGKSTYVRRRLPPYPQMKQNAVKECLERFPKELRARLRAMLEQETGAFLGVRLDKIAKAPKTPAPAPARAAVAP